MTTINDVSAEILISTEPFRMSGRDLAKSMLLIYGLPWVGVSLSLAAVFLAAAVISDIRWGIVFLMIIFLVAPMILFFFYIFHGLKRVTTFNCVNHRVDFLRDKAVLILLRKTTDPEDGDESYEGISCMWIPYSAFGKTHVVPGGICLEIVGHDDGILWLPESVWADTRVLEKAIDIIYGRGNL